MKTFVIQFKDGSYLANHRSLRYASNSKTGIVTDPNEAKHYANIGSAKGRITIVTNECEKNIADSNQRIKNYATSGNKYNTGWITDNIKSLEDCIEFIKDAKAIEVDVTVSNVISKQPLVYKFDQYDKGLTTKKTQGNCHCKGCGIYFTKIPVMVFGKYKPARICPLCVIEYHGHAQTLLDEMKEEERNDYENERFVNRL